MGAVKVCFKQLSAETNFKSLFCTQAKILSELCHDNLPWLHAFCDSPNTTAMTLHPYDQENISLNIFDALYGKHQSVSVVFLDDWNHYLLVSTSALVYLQLKVFCTILRRITLIERLSNVVRVLLIDFFIKHAILMRAKCTNCHTMKRNTKNIIHRYL